MSSLRSFCDYLVRMAVLKANPARGVKLPARAKRKNIYLTAEQLQALAVESVEPVRRGRTVDHYEATAR